MSLWEFFNSTAGGASILGAILAVAGYFWTRETKTILERMDTANRVHHRQTQDMLDRMDRGTKDILERMDRQAEARYRDLKDHLDGEAERP